MKLKVANNINPTWDMNTFTKTKCGICMDKCLKYPKRYIINESHKFENLGTNGACVHNTNLNQFLLSTNDPIIDKKG